MPARKAETAAGKNTNQSFVLIGGGMAGVAAAKAIRDFARANPLLVVKGGVVEGRTVGPAEVTALADVEPREVLLAKLAGAMNASLQQAVSLFAAPLSQAARVIEALRAAAEADPSLIGGAGETPAAEVATEAVAEAAPEAEASAEAVEVDVPEAPATEVEAPAEAEQQAEAPAEAEPQAEAPAEVTPDAAAAAEEIAEG